eukprot:3551280-Pleurochrysis_carterae.AAC.1
MAKAVAEQMGEEDWAEEAMVAKVACPMHPAAAKSIVVTTICSTHQLITKWTTSWPISRTVKAQNATTRSRSELICLLVNFQLGLRVIRTCCSFDECSACRSSCGHCDARLMEAQCDAPGGKRNLPVASDNAGKVPLISLLIEFD